MREFSDLSVETQPAIDKLPGYAGDLLGNAKNTYSEFRKWCELSRLGNFDCNNVADVFGVAEVLHETGLETLTLGHRELSIEQILRDIQLWIWQTYHQLPIKRGEPHRTLPVDRAPYEKLFSALRDLWLANRTTVVTTNYDIVVEYDCFLHDIYCGYPTQWDSSFAAGHGSQLFVSRSKVDPPGPIVCKLHGSIKSTSLRISLGRSSPIAIAADPGDGKNIGPSRGRAFKNEPAVVAVGAIELLHKRYGRTAVPAIVPPSYAKLRQGAWLNDMWGAALTALRDAREIIFIGYSLPASDGFMRSLLAGASALRTHSRLPNVTVIDCSSDVRNRYKKIFGIVEPVNDLGFADGMIIVIPSVLERLAQT